MIHVITVVGWLAVLCASGVGAAETWSNVPLIDTMCSTKAKDKPDAHTTACARQDGGFGIIAGGTYLTFDAGGNDKVKAALKATGKTDHLRVSVTGERQGDTIKVTSVRID